MPIPVVDLPLGATEDRVIGALNLERALSHGETTFEPGLLAQANRGYLYVDEVNLLEDHIVDLLLDELLPRAAEGLDRFGVDPAERDRMLGIIEQRCRTGRTGATWQVDAVRAFESRGLRRPEALREMLARYVEHQRSNEPVHTWPTP